VLYDQGYTIKGVQKLLRENGNQFLVAVANGDVAAIEAIAQRKQAEAAAAHACCSSPAARPTMRCCSARPRRSPTAVSSGSARRKTRDRWRRVRASSRDNRALLQEALFDLLECKRLLDQVR
jgi:hypothetical protein